jgi:histidyl-tRNA synthetase
MAAHTLGQSLSPETLLGVTCHGTPLAIDQKFLDSLVHLPAPSATSSSSSATTIGSGTSTPLRSSSGINVTQLTVAQGRAAILGLLQQLVVTTISISAANGKGSSSSNNTPSYELIVFLQSLLNTPGLSPKLVCDYSSTLDTQHNNQEQTSSSSSLSSVVPRDSPFIAQLLAFVDGRGEVITTETSNNATSNSDKYFSSFLYPKNAPGLSRKADATLIAQCATGAVAGVAALALLGASSLAVSADALAALSFEALSAPTEVVIEASCVRQGNPMQASSASSIALLLDGSLRIKPFSSVTTNPVFLTNEEIASTSQINGAAASFILNAVKAISTELSSSIQLSSSTLVDASRVYLTALSSQPLALAIDGAIEATILMAQASLNRSDALGSAAGHALANRLRVPASSSAFSPFSLNSSLERALKLQSLVNSAIYAFAVEFLAIDTLISEAETKASTALALKEQERTQRAAAHAASEAARIAALTGADLAKHEAEVAKKKEKELKRLEKERKEGAAAAGVANVNGTNNSSLSSSSSSSAGGSSAHNPLGLARGTLELRSIILSSCSVSTTQAPLSLTEIETALSPYSFLSIQRFDAAVKRVVEELTLRAHSQRLPPVAKGARDFLPEQMEVRENMFGIIRGVFKRHGACEIETPVFEDRQTLLGKYGEDGGKLVYDLADQGGALLSLRYDLTVPFARYLATNGVETMKRFHIARVYRRDQPNEAKGRFREFYQCDFDVAGVYAPMMADAEVLSVASEVLSSLPIGPFLIKLSHRGLLDGLMEVSGVPKNKFRTICSAIDKLDKEPWSAVKDEMVNEKGLPESVADKIGKFVVLSGKPVELLAKLRGDESAGGPNDESNALKRHAGAMSALADLGRLFTYLEALGGLSHISLDLSLARGLDYYTGVIYEAITLDPAIGVGSIAAGGRYDELVGMFKSKQVPCVGVSIGVERVFTIMEARAKAAAAAAATSLKRQPVQVCVASIPSTRGRDMAVERLKALRELWAEGLSAEASFATGDPKLAKQLAEALEKGNSVMVILAEDELDRGEASLKVLSSRDERKIVRANLGKEARAAVEALSGRGTKAVAAVADIPVALSSSSSSFVDSSKKKGQLQVIEPRDFSIAADYYSSL